MSKTGGGIGTNQYRVKGVGGMPGGSMRSRYRRAGEPEGVSLVSAEAEYRAVGLKDLRLLAASDADLGRFRSHTRDRAIARYVERRAEFAFSSAFLEGNSFTLPEVYTLLEGTAPDGKDVTDVDQILDLTEASELLVNKVRGRSFRLDLDTSDELNGVLARNEAIFPGVRRNHSIVNSDGKGATVNVMGDIFYAPDKETLAASENVLAERTSAIVHPVLRAVNYAAMASYLQMYFDGNKRTARYMADGELMTHGFEAIAIPAARAPEYQLALAAMFRTADTTPYAAFLLDVAQKGDPVA